MHFVSRGGRKVFSIIVTRNSSVEVENSVELLVTTSIIKNYLTCTMDGKHYHMTY